MPARRGRAPAPAGGVLVGGGGAVAPAECIVHGIDDVGGRDAELAYVEDVAFGRGPQPLPPFPQRLAVRRLRGDEGAGATPGDDDAVALELAVGASDGAGGEADLVGESTHGRKAAAGFEASHRDHHGELGPELLEPGYVMLPVEADDEASFATVAVDVVHHGTAVVLGRSVTHLLIVSIQ